MPQKTISAPVVFKQQEKKPAPKKENEDSDESSSSSDDDDSDDSNSEKGVDENEIIKSEFLDKLIIRLMKAPQKAESRKKNRRKLAPLIEVHLELDELKELCNMAIKSFEKQSSLLTIKEETLPLIICADIHGQFADLRNIFLRCGPPHRQSYLFLGDYVDRGVQGIEVISLLLALKIKYPTKVYLLRGNHEDANTCASYGFYDECINRFMSKDNKIGEDLWKRFVNVFNWIPLAAIVNKKILCMHGGISPGITSLQAIADIPRPRIIPPYGLMCDLVWADPEEKLQGWAMNSRGISLSFSDKVVEQFCTNLNIDLIVRGHQLTKEMIRNGYRFFFKGRLLSIFSAPNYLNMRNSACVLKVSKSMKCRFIVFKMQTKKQRKNSE
ncbi:unnamed protein product [Bursaphelenchus okinawaensis]|uniref:Serine/threonine-protein phosphatase n=1 Tax=Bursaphelenchus okinawaensis TaxID=465554 RepID=A0A811LP49_9BILA|nr:unnamed protein product [Bursaphelenchus okinawaensis]CAG9125170.1 unnamed protein product [Bursaphelenchus okinawaensis]